MSLERKKNLIMEYEKSLAEALSEKLLERPKMSVWMILIPLIFVFHCQRHKRFVESKRVFIREWLRNKEQALLGAVEELSGGNRNVQKWQKMVSHLPESAVEAYVRMQNFLCDHYKKVLSGNGKTFGKLVLQAYAKEEFVEFIACREKVEQELSKELLVVHTVKEEQEMLFRLDKESAALYEQSINVFYL